MRQRLWITFVLILLLASATIYISLPHTTNLFRATSGQFADISLREGLDLKGGTSLLYEADTSGISNADIQDALNGVRDVMEERVNVLGVTEPDIRVTSVGTKRAISVDLPGVSDVEHAKAIVGTTAKLEFKDASGNVVLEGKDLQPQGAAAAPDTTTSSGTSNAWQVNVTMTPAGKDKFAKATAANINKQIGIYLDDQLVSNPTVNQAITDGNAVITGGFTADQAKDFALKLNYGALPVPVHLIQETTVGASLGSDAISRSLVAGLIGMILLALYLIAYYRIPGVLAVLALIIYATLNIAIYKLGHITMTLAGIAGFIISLGISTDTNILTFERLKEELRMGKPLAVAVQQSFRRSWTSIRDSHVAGLISATIIFLFGSGSVRGFALILIIGTLLSLFSAITVTRNWMLLMAGSRLQNLLKNF